MHWTQMPLPIWKICPILLWSTLKSWNWRALSYSSPPMFCSQEDWSTTKCIWKVGSPQIKKNLSNIWRKLPLIKMYPRNWWSNSTWNSRESQNFWSSSQTLKTRKMRKLGKRKRSLSDTTSILDFFQWFTNLWKISSPPSSLTINWGTQVRSTFILKA